MVGYECVICQKMNYILDCSHFRGYSQSTKTNKQCQKQIIIIITIATRLWVRSMHDKSNILSFDQRSEHKA